ncbi:MAG TPA: aminomethyl-transferring glycine dehydrogenase [Geminicoccaceae bacterium]|nr:aminomethyl-transferring glycine dehydrogenase [Geminicoccaceae bacterium]
MAERRVSLSELEDAGDFVRRHIGPDDAEIEAMLETVGARSLDDLIEQAAPRTIRTKRPLDLPPPVSERIAIETLRRMAERNRIQVSMIGMGYYGTITPAVIQRNVLENPGWYTAYTPYQAEISQGRLEALLTFQQVVIDLTGLELANASLLDEATAAAEAMAMAKRVGRSAADAFFVDADCHPQTLAVLRTRAGALGFEIVVGDPLADLEAPQVFGALLHYPGSSGAVRDFRPAIERLHDAGALAVMATDLLSLVLLRPPGELGADVAIGSTQRFGVPMGYGGPHAAFFATREVYKRAVPGRLIGVSKDAQGRPALRMALQTREQHIRREKATSNICTAQVLLAVVAAMYAVYHGPEGLTRIASRVHRMARILTSGLTRLGVEVTTGACFDTITLRVPNQAAELAGRASERGINLRLVDADHLGVALDETTRREHLETLWQVLGAGAELPDLEALEHEVRSDIPEPLRRTSGFLTHPVFELHHSETEMLRYLRRLQNKDVALDRSMIPLGSCTMKLNATTEMVPITWPQFGAIHPFAPPDQVAGYRQLLDELSAWLAEITGFEAISLQPNAGSQGEYAGLLAIRQYHRARGEAHRRICLIPASAHGTNPASAHLAGLEVVVVGCDHDGNVDLDDLRAKAAAHSADLAALMITYPSTHGVFEESIRDICGIVHEHGGQVYLDGANLNALVGICRPAEIGADVAHLNLHKTFCIPHGGGGPGMGPIGVRAHLTRYLPGHVVVPGVNPQAGAEGTTGQVSAAPWGSPSILPISWAYIAMMGAPGLTRATQVAILNANYVARRLAPHYPIVYAGKHGRVAHECIIDLRPVKQACGVSTEDVAKRLIDYGIHAPTMSWPVPETMMIEPTESEAKGELDRFCDAMISIRSEIAAIERGEADPADNLLKRAPHTPDLLISEWTRPYAKAAAFFPAPGLREDKYWPPVGRIDNVQGDRHLVCSCPPIETYQAAAE